MSEAREETPVIANAEGAERTTITVKKSLGWPLVEDQDEDPNVLNKATPSPSRSAQEENSPYTSDSDSIGTTTDEELSSAEICRAERVRIYSSTEAGSLIKVSSLNQPEQPRKDTLESLLDYFARTASGGRSTVEHNYNAQGSQLPDDPDSTSHWPRPPSKSMLADSERESHRDGLGRSCVMWNTKEEWYSPGLDLHYQDPYTRQQKVLFRKFLNDPFSEARVPRTEYVGPFDTSLGPSRT